MVGPGGCRETDSPVDYRSSRNAKRSAGWDSPPSSAMNEVKWWAREDLNLRPMDYVVRNAVLGNCSCVALLPYILYICITLCPGKASCLPVHHAAKCHWHFGRGSPTALTN